MKAKVYDCIRTLEDVESDFTDRIIPQETIGTIIECYILPQEGYSVDLAIPNKSLVGGYEFENVILLPQQFEVVNELPAGTSLA